VLQAVQQERAAEALEKGREEGLEKGREEGLEKGLLLGKAEAILAVLAARGLRVTPSLRRTITACSDTGTLDAWLLRAATAASTEDVVREVPLPRSPSRRR